MTPILVFDIETIPDCAGIRRIHSLPDDLPGFIEVDMGQLTIGHSVHVKELKLPKGVEAVLHRGENPVVATIIQPVLITEEETTAEVVSAADVPTTEQAAPDKDAAAGGDKAGAKPGDKAAADKGGKPGDKAPEKKEKK